MANLIPPDAKKAIVTEYWFRVATVWLLLVGIGLCVVVLLKAPTFVLIKSQLRTFSGEYNEAQGRKDAFEASKKVLKDANAISQILGSYDAGVPFSETITILDAIAGEEVVINNFRLTRNDAVVENIEISGVAETRTSLADFSRDIEAHELFAAAELPISNLAKDKDIAFTIEITPTPK